MDNIIEIKDLCKTYGDLKAVDNISFDVKRGSFFAFLGINGAGKSTTINMICSTLAKNSGSIIVDGYDIDHHADKVKESIGIVFQNSVLDGLLSVKQNLICRGGLYGYTSQELKERVDYLIKLFELEDIAKRPYGKLSGGQRRRVDIARALLGNPKVLILDEPTTGLDPATRQKVWSIIENIRQKENLTIFLTTHYMEEANNSEQVIVIDKGRIMAEGTPGELKDKYTKDILLLYIDKDSALEEKLDELGLVYSYQGHYKIYVSDSRLAMDIVDIDRDKYSNFEFVKGNMDDAFLNITGKSAEGVEV